MVVIEELEHAKARGAKIYAELLGYGVSSDANHVSDPDPTGENPARALTMAFADAGIEPEDVGYVNAHGTSTPAGDTGETRVLKVALGEDKAYRTPISSTKGATGHCLGAAGAVEAIFTILALERGILPPTINQTTPDPTCDLDYIPNEARHEQVEIGVSNSFGFGGHNACLVFRRWHDEDVRLRVLVSGHGRRQLQEHRVPPDAVELGDPLAPADDAEACALVQGDARCVLREDAGLDRPDARRAGCRHELAHQRGRRRPGREPWRRRRRCSPPRRRSRPGRDTARAPPSRRSRRPPRRRAGPRGAACASKASHEGGSVSKVALPVAMPSAQIAATCWPVGLGHLAQSDAIDHP